MTDLIEGGWGVAWSSLNIPFLYSWAQRTTVNLFTSLMLFPFFCCAQTQAAERAYSAAGRKLPLILWTSRLTEKGEVEKYLSKDDYIIQVLKLESFTHFL